MSQGAAGVRRRFSVLGAFMAVSLLGLALPAAGNAVTTTFTNSSPIAITPGGGDAGVAGPYPSSINVGQPGTVNKATATIKGLTHTRTRDIDIALVSPGGQKVLLMSDVCGNNNTNITLGFDDAAAGTLPTPTPCPSATYQPTNAAGINEPDDFPNGPPPPYASKLAAFNGGPSNGAWSLFVYDEIAPNRGDITGGFTITLDITPPPPGTPGGGGALVGNAFSFGKAKRRNNGSALLPVTVGAPGTLVAEDAATAKKTALAAQKKKRRKRRRSRSRALVKRTVVQVRQAGTVNLPIKPSQRAKTAMRRRRSHSLSVNVKVTFTPTGGTSASQTKRVTLKRKVTRRKRRSIRRR